MPPSLPVLPENFKVAQQLIDDAHAQDPNKVEGQDVPYELHYAKKMTSWLERRCPEASPALQLACRAQHFRRWEIPRNTYPMTRSGYLTWRAKLKAQAASQVSDLISNSPLIPPLPQEDVSRIAALIKKENLAQGDLEVQVLEDCACLVFLDDQFDDFEKKEEIDDEKITGILQKTWKKMSDEGRNLALEMQHSDRAKALIGNALQESSGS